MAGEAATRRRALGGAPQVLAEEDESMIYTLSSGNWAIAFAVVGAVWIIAALGAMICDWWRKR